MIQNCAHLLNMKAAQLDRKLDTAWAVCHYCNRCSCWHQTQTMNHSSWILYLKRQMTFGHHCITESPARSLAITFQGWSLILSVKGEKKKQEQCCGIILILVNNKKVHLDTITQNWTWLSERKCPSLYNIWNCRIWWTLWGQEKVCVVAMPWSTLAKGLACGNGWALQHCLFESPKWWRI